MLPDLAASEDTLTFKFPSTFCSIFHFQNYGLRLTMPIVSVRWQMTRYMDECDLLRFFIKEEVDEIMQRLGEAETGRVKRSDVTKWVVSSVVNCAHDHFRSQKI